VAFYESINVARIAVRNNVEIESGNRRPLDDSGHTADEHEAHATTTQCREDGSEVSRSSWHDGARSPN